MNRPSTPALPRLLAALGLAKLLISTSLAADPAAQLISNSLDKNNPNANFTIRFAKPMVEAASVGKVADPAPVELQPAAKGKFTWLSTRSGVFAPEEPLPLSTTFRFAFRAGAKDMAGEALDGEFDATFQTPGLTLKGSHSTKYLYREDVTAEPDFNLLFNADINAAEAGRFLTFTNTAGKKIAANVVQADPVHQPLHRFPRYRSSDQSLLTWSARFYEKITPSLGGRTPEVERHNQLYVKPAEPLTVGDDWKLVIAEGLPSTEAGVNLLEAVELPIGTVKPFVVRNVDTLNDGHGERRIVVRFSKPLAESVKAENVQQWIKITPAPKKLAAKVEGAQVTLSGGFKLETEYQVDIARGLAAVEPFTLLEPKHEVVSFEPIPPSLVLEGFATHQLSSGTRHFHMRAVNVPKIRVTAKLFQPETAPLALKAYGDYLNPPDAKDDEFHRKINADKLPGKTIYSRIITGTAQVDTETEIKLAWNDILGVGKTGAVLVTAEEVGKGSRPGVQAIVQVTDLGMVWKSSTNETFAHVFSLASGAPVAGVKVHLVSDENLSMAAVTTDATGMAVLPSSKNAHWLRAENGSDLHLVPLDDDTNHLSLYRFHLPFRDADEEESTSGRQVLLFTERGVYRPGETVHLKGIIRDPRSGQARIPAGTKARLKAFDNREREILSKEVTLSAYGSIDADIPLPKGTLGTYSATLSFGKADAEEDVATHEFEVQEYTPNAFEITIGGPKTVVGAQPLELPVSGKYLMGKSLSKAQLSWSIEAEDRNFAPEEFDKFSFCDAIDDYRLNRILDRASHFADQGQLDLGDDGKATVATTVQLNTKAPQPRSARLLCEVTDLNQQTVSQAAELMFHASDFYLGIGELPEVVQKGDKLAIPVVAVRTDGTPNPEPVAAKLRVTRIDWQNNRVVTDEDASETQTEPIFKVISEQEIQTQRAEQREHKWHGVGEPVANLVAGEPGLYLLEATAKDVAGRGVITSTTFYVTGENVTEWNYRNEFQIELVSDKLAYLSGETARILVKTPISGDALVTIERDKVLRSFTTKLSGNAPSVEIPLQGVDAPNVFVSVMLLRGAKDSPRKFKEPDYRVGFCQLKVTRPESKLTVYVTPEKKAYQPGDTVTVSAEVYDFNGKPTVGAEVTLYAVDEGVLSLTGYETPDPLAFFNKPLPLTVSTSLTLPSLLREDPEEKQFENKGYMIGGGGDLGEAFRKNFVTCALWNANLRTDENGKAAATFTAPDSLTRYRVIAVVQTKQDAFGAGESAFEVNKPVMLEPALPRFANIGDKLALRAVLHNLTDIGGEVEVQLALDETATGQNLTRRLELPAHGSLAVDFPVEFKTIGDAKWKWTARFTGGDGKTAFRDAVQTTLKVGWPVAELREVKLKRVEAAETDLLKDADPAVLEGNGVVRVSLGNSRIIELRETLNQLLHYPYGCVEQTTSSTLPWIVLKDFRDALPELARSDEQIRDSVNYGIDRLLTMQTSGGGLSYWPGGREPHFWGSAYGGLGLAMAKRAGYEVPAGPFDSLCKYLSAALRGTADINSRWGLGERCMAVYTLALAGRAEPAYHEVLFNKRDQLTGESRALLALAIIESKGLATMTEELLKPLAAEGYEEDAFWSGSRDSAIRLLAWSQFRPQDPAVDATVTELLGKREGGHWLTTQGNAWSLLAFSYYLRNVEKPAPHIDGSLAWAGKNEKFLLEKKAPLHRVEMPIAAGADRLPMNLANPDKLRIFSEVEIVAHPKSLNQPRQDQGYSIKRTYSKVNDDGTLSDLKDPVIGDRVLITLRIDVRKKARYIAVNDPMPSIFEAVNPVFKSQETRAGEVLGRDWPGDFSELRDDRALFFADYIYPGEFTIRYLARVRAAGTATAPSAKVEEMYHPDRFGLTETMQLTSLPLK
ncbi:MAG: MG2 domain-containing protein [Chthoniobacteraceae bacterium]